MPSEPRFRSLRSLVFKRNQDSESSSGPLLSRRGLLGAAVGCGFCALGGFVAGRVTAGPSTVGRTRTVDQRRSVQPNGLFRVRTNEPVVALTFDDGPDPRCTPDVLSLLKDAEAVATFFLVGVNAAADPELVRKVLASGHSVGNHTYDHRELQLLTPANVRSEIDRGQRSLIRAGAPAPRLFRPPMGFTDEAVAVLADADRFRTVFWDACVERFIMDTNIDDGVDRLLDKVGPGSIILAHDGGRIVGSGREPHSRARTVEALPRLLRGLEAKGLRVVDVPTLLASTRES